MIDLTLPLGFLGIVGGAFDFIFHEQPAVTGGGVMVGGPDYVFHLAWTQLWISLVSLGVALAIALPAGIYFGHRGRGEFFAIGIGNAGRALPELALIAFLAAFIGIGAGNAILALMVLGIPPILTNTFVAIGQVDRNAVDAARGMGMKERQVVLRVELPLAAPTIMTGVRTASVNIFATATIATLIGVSTLGDLILGRNVYGDDGVFAGAMVVAFIALALELILAGLQRALTPKGVRLRRAASRSSA